MKGKGANGSVSVFSFSRQKEESKMTGYDQLDGVHIPWQRLTTAYGRGTELPALMAARAYEKIAPLIEHQSTLWQVTPTLSLYGIRLPAAL